jgi:hypothetical protein
MQNSIKAYHAVINSISQREECTLLVKGLLIWKDNQKMYNWSQF